MAQNKPMVLCISGLDPTGGAGIQADIETLAALGCYALPIISSLTVQTTSNVRETHPVAPDLIRRQFDALIESGITISAIKLGLMDCVHTITCVADILKEHQQIPVIADPVLKAGGGFEFGGCEIIDEYKARILPHCTVLTPNTLELSRLSPSTSEDDALSALCHLGCNAILLTGTHRDSDDVSNRLFGLHPELHDRSWLWPRLPFEYHGSGCTLASALAAGIAQGQSLTVAAFNAQQFTWTSLEKATPRRIGQSLPNRQN